MNLFQSIHDKLNSDSSLSTPNEMKSAHDQPKADLELAAFVKSKIEEYRTQANRVSHEGIWMTNIAYLLGYDSVYYDPAQRQFRPSNAATPYVKRSRLRSNLLLPAAQNRLARMLKNPPKYDVRPNSLDEDDKEAARLGVECIGMVWDKQAVNRKRIDLGMWLQECGHSYFKISWDPELGDPIPSDFAENKTTGDIRIEVASPFECFPDPMARTFEECGSFIQGKVRKLDYFRNQYPERGDLVKDEGAWLMSAQYEQRINSINTGSSANGGTTDQIKNSAIELSYYEKRSPKYPRGRHVIVANGVILKNDALPCGEIPFVKFDDVVIGGKYYSESLITHGRPLQDQYNRTLTKRADWMNKMLAGKYIAAKGHGLMQEALNSESGEIVEYDPVPNASEPKAMDLPTIPSYAYTEGDMIKKDLYEIFGLSEVSRGQLPSASIPAQGLQILLEQDETRIGVEVEQHEHAYARLGQLILKFADNFYVMDQKLKTKGKDLEYQIKTFNGQMLRKNFDVTVIRGSTIPNNKVVKRQEIMNLFSQGLLGNPQDPAVIQKLLGNLEYGEIGAVWEKYHLDMAQIKETLNLIQEGISPIVNKLDNHVLHILQKNEFRISEKFKQLSPLSQQILQANIDEHIALGAQLANPQIQPPPDDGMPPPEEMLNQLRAHAEQRGISLPPPGMSAQQPPPQAA